MVPKPSANAAGHMWGPHAGRDVVTNQNKAAAHRLPRVLLPMAPLFLKPNGKGPGLMGAVVVEEEQGVAAPLCRQRCDSWVEATTPGCVRATATAGLGPPGAANFINKGVNRS